jgi:hypothetical protein
MVTEAAVKPAIKVVAPAEALTLIGAAEQAK